jgi:bifunctional DNA-binding transcriptional regulator/antitoxin component of YhaV-PrlF toxin-antitoxin module
VPRLSSEHQVTLPVESLERAGMHPGDEVSIEADGPDRIVVTRIPSRPADALGVFDGLSEPDYPETLRAGERA